MEQVGKPCFLIATLTAITRSLGDTCGLTEIIMVMFLVLGAWQLSRYPDWLDRGLAAAALRAEARRLRNAAGLLRRQVPDAHNAEDTKSGWP